MLFSKLSVAAIFYVATTSFAQNACCDSITTLDNTVVSTLDILAEILGTSDPVPVGLGCIPIIDFGVSGTSCTADPVSCDQLFGLVGINCTPVDAGLEL